MKKSFLLYNTDACFLGVAQRLEEEGYKTYSYYSEASEHFSKNAGKGMINIVDDLYDILQDFSNKKDDLIILIDGNSGGDECDYLRKEGWHVIGSSHLCEDIEHDRAMGNKIAGEMGLNLPQKVTFTDFKKAKDYLSKQKDDNTRLVFKGDGLDMAGGSFTYLSNTIKGMIEYLNWVEQVAQSGKSKIDKFHIQEVVEGVEVDFAAWFNGDKFVPALFVDFEQKRIHGLGKATGCLGQIEFFLDPNKEPYFKKYMPKLLPKIKGDVANEWAVNNIIADEDHAPYFLEFTPRFGWDSTIGELAILKDAGRSIGDYFERIAFRKDFSKNYFPYKRYSCSVRIHSGSVGDQYDDVKGKPIFWDEKFSENLWWYGIKKCDAGYEISGNPIGIATACGDTPEEAMAKVYEIINPKNNHLMIPDLFYSETIGEGVSENIKKLQDWGIMSSDGVFDKVS